MWIENYKKLWYNPEKPMTEMYKEEGKIEKIICL
jgi:hypothetical protein